MISNIIMILNINSTRRHTSSLLVYNIDAVAPVAIAYVSCELAGGGADDSFFRQSKQKCVNLVLDSQSGKDG